MKLLLLAFLKNIIVLKKFYKSATSHANSVLFTIGFIFDILVLPDAGHEFTIWIGGFYLSVVATLIAFREWIISRNTASLREAKIYNWLTFGIAYFSGSTLSFASVYSIRSADFLVSWPLIFILLMCVFINEVISARYFRFTLDVGVLIIATLFFLIFNVPNVTKVQNDGMFLLSAILAVVASLIYATFLQFFSESAKEELSKLYALSVGIPLFAVMLYFLNIIPPVPLSLAHAGVYHYVEREGGAFVTKKEIGHRFFESLRTPVYHLFDSNSVYFFSAVHAPAKLTAPLSHVWEYYDESKHDWVISTVVPFTIEGGREDGYRAYSKKENVQPGLWRVTVKVGDKRIVGRVKFIVSDEYQETIQLLPEKM